MVQHFYFDVLLLLWLTWAVYWIASVVYERMGGKTKDTERRVTGTGFVFFILLIILLTPVGYDWPLGAFFRVTPPVVKVIGLLITGFGVAFAIWARARLGANWSGIPSVKKGHTLITGGPYSIVRHPIYTGLLFGVTGSALVLGTYGSLVVILATVVVISIRIRQEERLMQEKFGDEYRDYRGRTKKIIPWVL